VPLQHCPECQTLVSESAPICPKCGRPHPTAKRPSKADQLAGSWGLAILAVAGTGGFMYVCRSEPSAMYTALLLGLSVVIIAVKHLADVLKWKQW